MTNTHKQVCAGRGGVGEKRYMAKVVGEGPSAWKGVPGSPAQPRGTFQRRSKHKGGFTNALGLTIWSVLRPFDWIYTSSIGLRLRAKGHCGPICRVLPNLQQSYTCGLSNYRTRLLSTYYIILYLLPLQRRISSKLCLLELFKEVQHARSCSPQCMCQCM